MVPASTRACATPAIALLFALQLQAQTTVEGGRMAEVFQQTILSGAGVLNDPWEIAYGPDGYLWITEAKGYKVYRMNPATGAKTTVLNIAQGSTFLPAADQGFNVQFTTAQNPWPQGGCAGLALHPDFMAATAPKNFVYLSYVHSYDNTAANNAGVFFTNYIVRFTFNTATNKLESPVALCDTLPGSSDHNSQRMIIAPVGGTDYLFYAAGDMGAGQFSNLSRTNKAQIVKAYEGKILRFNLEPDGDAGALDEWIPNDNPFNGTAQSAVWSLGLRNNQGFAFANINGTDYLYGSSHGPFSDDEVNSIERGKNYGHPLVIGFSGDGNYDGAKAGPASSSLPLIGSEATNAATIGVNYRDPLFSLYPAPKGNTSTPWSIQYIYTNQNYYNAATNQTVQAQNANGFWESEAPSGMDIYTHTLIPGWKNSLLLGLLKGGRVMRLKLNAVGNAIASSDTISYFRSVNRFRDVALAPDGKTVFAIIDKSSTTSGPTATNPVVSACAGCVIKYTFLGYAAASTTGKSTIPASIQVTTGPVNSCNAATTITIDATNNNLWVPITGPDGNIMAEIKANGNNLGTVTASFFQNTTSVRTDAKGRPYLDRNMTITPQTQPTSPVSIRLYLTATELNTLKARTGSSVTGIASLAIFKNGDACGSALQSNTLEVGPTYAEAFGSNYVIQANINSFSSFYFASAGFTALPLQLRYVKAAVQNGDVQLQWQTANETNTLQFGVERSADGVSFAAIHNIAARGNGDANYAYADRGAALLPVDVLYYRLKITDRDGSFYYSTVVAVHLQKQYDVLVYPNPVKNKINIRMSNPNVREVQVQVSDLQGRIVHSSREPVTQPGRELQLDARRLKPQLYVLKIIAGNGDVLAVQKFEKL